MVKSENLNIKTEFQNVQESGSSEEEPLLLFSSKKSIKRAGDVIRHYAEGHNDEYKYLEAILKLKQYRENHALALKKFVPLLELKLKRLGLFDKSIVSSRIKRRESIIIKLHKKPKMQLSRMNDIAGVRIIFNDMQDLNDFIKDDNDCEIINSSCIDETVNTKNRIKEPKPCGYRGIHKIYKCEVVEGKFLRIELQLRTKIQHEWATTVEILGSIERTSFKTGEGSDKHDEFFLLSSALFAREEQEPVASSCEKLTDLEVCKRLINLNEELRVTRKLKEVNDVFKKDSLPEQSLEVKCYLIQLDLESQKNKILAYTDVQKANEHYGILEKQYYDNNNFEIVLVSVDNIDEAYPNYFLNSADFINRYHSLISKYI